MGNLSDRLKKAFVQTNLHAAMADAPAVMTASGWKHDDKGNIYQDKKAFEKGSPEEELRNNLAVLGGATLAATAAPVIIPTLDTALMPTTRAMYSPYTKNIYKEAINPVNYKLYGFNQNTVKQNYYQTQGEFT